MMMSLTPQDIVDSSAAHHDKLKQLRGIYMLGAIDRKTYTHYRKRVQNRKYYQSNKQQLRDKRNAKTCFCPTCYCIIAKASVKRHQNSKRHKDMLVLQDHFIG